MSKPNTTSASHASLNSLMLRKLMPLLVIVYVISFLDRTNIALAKHSMSIDLGISAAAYGLGAGLFFLTYAAFEIPSNLIMHKVGARFWITRIMVTWGALSVAMAFVTGETSFYVMRLLLGAAEAPSSQTAPPSSKCSGEDAIGEASTSSIVIGSRYFAAGCYRKRSSTGSMR